MSSADRARLVLIELVLLVAILGLGAASCRKDPETGKIRVLYIGDYGASSPYPALAAEPLIDLSFAWPSAMEGVSREEARRMLGSISLEHTRSWPRMMR